MDWPTTKGPGVMSVFVTCRSAVLEAPPKLFVLSVLFPRLGSDSVAETVALLSKRPMSVMVAVTVMVTFAPLASEGIVQGSAAQPPPLTFVKLRWKGVSVTRMLVAVDGPALATTSVYWTDWPLTNGPAVMRFLLTDTSADGAAVPPLPVLSVLSARFGSDSAGVAVAVLSYAPVALIVAVTLMVVFAPDARLGIVHGKAAQPLPLTRVMVRLDGVSVTWMLVAV